jgi:hypothetical protein
MEKSKAAGAAGASTKPLTLEELILALPQSGQPDKVVSLSLRGRAISQMPAQLAFLKSLRKLDLNENALVDIAPLAKIPTLTQLKLAGNRIRDVKPIAGLVQLTVLDVGKNQLTSLAGIERMVALKALIAPDNKLADLGAIEVLAKAGATLETIVVSRNPLSTSDALLPITATAASLRKLSASQCGLTALPVLDLPLVNELRLAGNGFEEFAEGTRFRSLKILDVSSNKLASIASMTLFALFVDQLHIHGNPVAEATDEAERSGFARIIARVFKQLAILDGRAFDRAAALKSSRPDRPDDNGSDDDVDPDAMADVPVARRPPRAERDRDVESAPAMRKQHVVPAPIGGQDGSSRRGIRRPRAGRQGAATHLHPHREEARTRGATVAAAAST